MDKQEKAVNSLEQYFEKIADHRRAEGTRYPLAKLITTIVISMLCGVQGYREQARFMKNNLEELKNHFGWTRNSTPSYETLRLILMAIDYEQINQAIIAWVNDHADIQNKTWYAIDGKAMRSTIKDHNDKEQNFASLVSVLGHELGISIEQQAYNSKKQSEIGVVTDIIQRLQGKGLILTLDALHCQKNT